MRWWQKKLLAWHVRAAVMQVLRDPLLPEDAHKTCVCGEALPTGKATCDPPNCRSVLEWAMVCELNRRIKRLQRWRLLPRGGPWAL